MLNNVVFFLKPYELAFLSVCYRTASLAAISEYDLEVAVHLTDPIQNFSTHVTGRDIMKHPTFQGLQN